MTDNGLGLPAFVSRNPARIGVGGVDGIEPGIDKGIENAKPRGFICGPPQNIAAKDDGSESELRAADFAHFHGTPPVFAFVIRSRVCAKQKPRAEFSARLA